MTRYAKRILELVCSAGKHMTAEQIFFLLKTEYPSVVLATVYNNLNALTAQGRIRRIRAEGCPDRYDNNTRHDHLICIRCGRLKDVALPDLTEQFSKAAECPIRGYDLKLYDLCEACVAQEASQTKEPADLPSAEQGTPSPMKIL